MRLSTMARVTHCWQNANPGFKSKSLASIYASNLYNSCHLATWHDVSTRTYYLELVTKLCPENGIMNTTLHHLRYWLHRNSLLLLWSLQGFFHFCTYRDIPCLSSARCIVTLFPTSARGDMPIFLLFIVLPHKVIVGTNSAGCSGNFRVLEIL